MWTFQEHILIWILANFTIDGVTVLSIISDFLNPFAHQLGLDGVILMAFILGLPANEIVLPIIIMAYMSTGGLTDMADLAEMKTLFVDNGWTWITAMSMLIFCLFHWPCATTCMTIKKETGSAKWTAISVLMPTVLGIISCFVFRNIAVLFV